MKPIATLPEPLAGYGFPESEDVLLPWSYVAERMDAARAYWVCTIATNAPRPQARPIWGVWVDDTLFFGGSPQTQWSHNLRANSQVSVHLEDGDQAIIFEGHATLVDDDVLMTKLDDAYEVKYNIRHGPPIWHLHPDRVFAWQSMQTVTKFMFG